MHEKCVNVISWGLKFEWSTIIYVPAFYMYQQKFQHSNKDKLPKENYDKTPITTSQYCICHLRSSLFCCQVSELLLTIKIETKIKIGEKIIKYNHGYFSLEIIFATKKTANISHLLQIYKLKFTFHKLFSIYNVLFACKLEQTASADLQSLCNWQN